MAALVDMHFQFLHYCRHNKQTRALATKHRRYMQHSAEAFLSHRLQILSPDIRRHVLVLRADHGASASSLPSAPPAWCPVVARILCTGVTIRAVATPSEPLLQLVMRLGIRHHLLQHTAHVSHTRQTAINQSVCLQKTPTTKDLVREHNLMGL